MFKNFFKKPFDFITIGDIAVDAFGLPLEFQLTGGEIHDAKAAPELIAQLPKSDYVVFGNTNKR